MSTTFNQSAAPQPPAPSKQAADDRRSCGGFLARFRRFLPRITSPAQSYRSLAEGYEFMARQHAEAGNSHQAERLEECADAIRQVARSKEEPT